MKIFKYPLLITDEQTIMMPENALIISVATQYGEVCVWALVSPEMPRKPVVVRVIGTGHEMPSMRGMKFVGSIMMHEGSLVWHIFADEKYVR